MALLRILHCALRIVLPWILFTLKETVSTVILLFSWIVCHIVSDNDADLPSLSSFTVDDKSNVMGSFYFMSSLRLASCCCCIPLWIDLPSLKAIQLGGLSFLLTSHAEFISQEIEMIWRIRSSQLGVVIPISILPPGQRRWQENGRQLDAIQYSFETGE